MSTSTAAPPTPPTTAAPQTRASARHTQSLGRYRAHRTGQERELLRVQRPDGSALVIDYELDTLCDGRLIAHLSPDEPAENAQIVSDLYLADASHQGRCRAVTPEDFDSTRHLTPSPPSNHRPRPASRLQDATGHIYRISQVPTSGHTPELRWTRSRHPGREDSFDTVTLRDVVGSLEAYEPARTQTHDALARHHQSVSTRQLRNELQRLATSVVVLNRRLREAVQRRVQRGELSMSEIALRCGRIKRDSHANASGETSWLARRIGQLPESGATTPSPWVHTDVLALIARDGLGIPPHEVEL
jgi:hypothetical protein